jgi:hypothetical protein
MNASAVFFFLNRPENLADPLWMAQSIINSASKKKPKVPFDNCAVLGKKRVDLDDKCANNSRIMAWDGLSIA